ncbi:MAG TPA: hypothetical protein VFI16_10280, partial [Anaeromyxobacteraceae bacterium]|nr:hypothetical protein [Anaeromyxobacteraceae bacterium]
GFEVSRRALRRFGRHFFRGTKARVAVSVVLERGLRAAREAGAAREARLARRASELAAGAEPWREAIG